MYLTVILWLIQQNDNKNRFWANSTIPNTSKRLANKIRTIGRFSDPEILEYMWTKNSEDS